MKKVTSTIAAALLWLSLGGCPPPAPEPLGTPAGVALEGRSATLTVRLPAGSGAWRVVTFYGRRHQPPGEDFTIVLLPDTQYYSERFPDVFLAQTRWIVQQRAARNIAAVLHLGDIVEDAGQTAQWQVADGAISLLDAAPQLPYGLAVGNHDQTPAGDPQGTRNFNRYFPARRYAGLRSWYGGHFGTDNDNHYILFSAGGLDFVAVFLEFDPQADPDVLAWAGQVLERHADRRAIVVRHFTMVADLLAAGFSAQGRATYEALKGNPNLFLILGGHFCENGWRSDRFGGRTVYSLLSDFQCRPNGGDGWLRLLEFSPARNLIRVRTYSPTRGQYLHQPWQEFTLPYEMSDARPFDELARFELAPAEAEARLEWTGLAPGAHYQWYAVVSDGLATVSTPLRAFQTP